jgi:hypothetical protein
MQDCQNKIYTIFIKNLHLYILGELIIEGVSASDSGRYMCVATNNRGSAYGTPIKVSVQQGNCLNA